MPSQEKNVPSVISTHFLSQTLNSATKDEGRGGIEKDAKIYILKRDSVSLFFVISFQGQIKNFFVPKPAAGMLFKNLE